jgi:uncharacterized membrane protein
METGNKAEKQGRMSMRRTELVLGLLAGIAGLLLALLVLLGVLGYLDGTLASAATSSYILVGANVIGIVGALTVRRHHIAGSVTMAAVTVTILVFGFPWQSIPGVIYIISVVLAVVPVKTAKESMQ